MTTSSFRIRFDWHGVLARARRDWFVVLLIGLVVAAYFWGPLQEWDSRIVNFIFH